MELNGWWNLIQKVKETDERKTTNIRQEPYLHNVEWKIATIANRDLKDTVLALRQQTGKDTFVESPGLIIQLMKLNLLDEFQFCIYPVVAGNGMPLFGNRNDSIVLKLIKTKTFTGRAEILYYKPTN